MTIKMIEELVGDEEPDLRLIAQEKQRSMNIYFEDTITPQANKYEQAGSPNIEFNSYLVPQQPENL
jgi:hypothetical protein